MCYSEHRFRLKACRNDIVLAETMTKAAKGVDHRSGQSSKIAGKESRPTKLKSWEMSCRSRFLRDRECGRNDDQRLKKGGAL